jgi:hypothetical protein
MTKGRAALPSDVMVVVTTSQTLFIALSTCRGRIAGPSAALTRVSGFAPVGMTIHCEHLHSPQSTFASFILPSTCRRQGEMVRSHCPSIGLLERGRCLYLQLKVTCGKTFAGFVPVWLNCKTT